MVMAVSASPPLLHGNELKEVKKMVGHVNVAYVYEAFLIVVGIPSAWFLAARWRRSRRQRR